MKKKHWIVLTVGIAIVLGIYAVPAISQTQQPAAASATPFYVAVVDVAQIIRLHPHFMTEQGKLKAQIDAAEVEFKARQEAIAEKQKRLEASSLKPGTQEYQQQFDTIANEIADFERDARTMQRRFALDNSKIMYETYQDIKKVIGNYATARGIAQITDYREFESNPAQPETVAEDMDQRLVWFDSRLNLTWQIVEQVYTVRGLQAPARPNPQTANPSAGQTLR